MARNEDEPHADDYADGRKRRRTKKPRDDDDWMPPPALTGRATAGVDPMQLSHVTSMPVPPLMPISSHSSSAVRISNLTTVESPSMAVMPVSSATKNASSVFHELPTMIQSFSETERRRKNGGSNSTATSMSALIHASSSNSTSKNGSSGSTRSSRSGEPDRVAAQSTSNGVGRHASSHPVSVMDFLFGDPYSSAKANGGDAGMNGSAKQPLKRKRRSDASSQRSSRRSARDEDRGSSREYDLLRFGVDSVKLVPQGLVDRVDDSVSRSFISTIIQNHVENWIKRAGFGDSFLPEITTLLTAYYPCSYPTILDEVLVGFLFKRPEFVDTLLKNMLEKVHKAGESATAHRYPVIHAFTRRCRPMHSRGAEKARHDFACTTLLRYLVENNTEKCMLSPWIAACAMHCSADIINELWYALLNAWAAQSEGMKASVNMQWAAQNSVQQAYELLLEEKQRLSSVGAGECPLSTALVRIMLLDPAYKKMAVEANPFIVQEAMEIFFTHANHRTSNEVLMSAIKIGDTNKTQHLDELLSFVVQAASKLSVKKSNWFANHVLRFVLTISNDVEASEKLITAVLSRYMPLLLGGIDKEELESCIQLTSGVRKLSNTENASSPKSSDGSLDIFWDVYRIVEHHTIVDIVNKLHYLLGLLTISNETQAILLMNSWSKNWSSEQTPVVLPWSYVYGLLNVAVDGSIAQRACVSEPSIVMRTFQLMVEQVCTSYFKLLVQAHKTDDGGLLITRFTEALLLLLPSEHPIAHSLLRHIVDQLCLLPKTAGASDTIFRNAVAIYLSGAAVEETASKNDVSKHQVRDGEGYDEAPRVSQPADHRVIVSLLGLASLETDAGKFVRRQLSTRYMVRMLVGLLNSEERSFKIPMLLNLITEVIAHGKDTKNHAEWMRQHVVHDIIRCAYNGGDIVSSSAVALLQHLSVSSASKSVDGRQVILWVIVRRCAKLCCGCVVTSGDEATVMKFYATATLFAEFVKTMLIVSRDAMEKVAKFIEQEMWTCSSGTTQMNIFLLLLLQKLSCFGLQQPTNCISAIQLAVSPICSLDRVRIIQLQFLKALCCRLGVLKHTKIMNGPNKATDHWKNCEDLLCSTRLQADLRDIIAAPLSTSSSASQTAVMLAEGVLKFTVELKQRRHP